MSKVRVLVVEDSLTIRKRLVEVLSESPELEVIGEAGDGQAGFELCRKLRPDVVTLDMMMPGLNGLAATEQIMAYCPTPILIVSASTNRGELFKMYEALAAGALDILEKPLGDEQLEGWEKRLVRAVKLIARIKVITHPRARLSGMNRVSPHQAHTPHPLPRGDTPLRAIAIGVSTGGPAALVELLGGLPADFPVPILIVLHIGQQFATSLADWLDNLTPMRVAFARDHEELAPIGAGCVRMAPPDRHLVLQEGKLLLDRGPERHSCRPSVDVLFESVARDLGASAAGVLLTGMGRDGAEGLLALRSAGGRTIAQDEASSIVYGMPKEAVALGAAEQILPLNRIAAALRELASGSSRRGT